VSCVSGTGSGAHARMEGPLSACRARDAEGAAECMCARRAGAYGQPAEARTGKGEHMHIPSRDRTGTRSMETLRDSVERDVRLHTTGQDPAPQDLLRADPRAKKARLRPWWQRVLRHRA
jgi:hypothetical protein